VDENMYIVFLTFDSDMQILKLHHTP